MILHDVVALLDGRVLTSGDNLDAEISAACGADLMSDVLFYMHSGSVLLSGLANPQLVITAEMADASALVIVRGKTLPPEMISLAEEKGIPLISAPHTLFECCGRLYMAGVESCDVHGEERRRSDLRIQEYVSGSRARNA